MAYSGIKIQVISEAEAVNLCEKEEGQFFDKKAKGVGGDKIQKLAVAFANADGGEFVVGIDDDDENSVPLQRWNGVDNTEEFNGLVQSLVDLNPTIDFRAKYIRIEGRPRDYVLMVSVNKGLHVFETPKKEVYVRQGPQSAKLANSMQIMGLAHAKGMSSEEDTVVNESSIDEIESGSHLKYFINQLPISDPDPLKFLLQENLIDPNSWAPRVAAILLFSDNPSTRLPKQCGVRIVRYDTRKDEIDRDYLTDDNELVEGPLYQQILSSQNKIKNQIAKNNIWTINGIKPMYFPDESIWEILVNCVIHRDYFISDNVTVSVFRNRVEFKSPGRFPGFMSADNILDQRFSRNSKLVRLLSKYKAAPNKDLGEGMNTAFQRMADEGLKYPEVLEEGNYVKVILRFAPPEQNEELILSFIEKFGEINNRQAVDIMGFDKSQQATSIFSKLRQRGIIERVDNATGANTRWKKVNTSKGGG